jgi:hypothetical protein
MALDAWYIRNASLLLDLKIALLTLKMVVLGEQQNLKAVEQAWREINRRPTETCRDIGPTSRLQA